MATMGLNLPNDYLYFGNGTNDTMAWDTTAASTYSDQTAIPLEMIFQPDVILTWPSHIDYPLWREWMRTNRMHFHQVIIVFTDMHAGTEDYREFIRGEMAELNIDFFDNDPVSAEQDWRDVAVRKALVAITRNRHDGWVWFTEQDFMPQRGFRNQVRSALELNPDIIAVRQDTRIHPCCIFARHSVVDQFLSDPETIPFGGFGVVPDEFDHFGLFQKYLEESESSMVFLPDYCYTHMNGLSQNIYLLQKGELPNYEPYLFQKYCEEVLRLGSVPPTMRLLFEKYVGLI